MQILKTEIARYEIQAKEVANRYEEKSQARIKQIQEESKAEYSLAMLNIRQVRLLSFPSFGFSFFFFLQDFILFEIYKK